MSLHRIHFQTYNRPILDMLIGVEEDAKMTERYDFDPPYQRASVWTPEQRTSLIKSLMQGLPIGSLFLNRRSILEPMRVVDGKQRLETLLMWIRDEVAVPADWFEARAFATRTQMNTRLANPGSELCTHGVESRNFCRACQDRALAEVHVPAGDVTWSDLSDVGQRLCANDWSVATYETKLKTAEQEAELYERINYGGTPHEALA